MNLHTFIWVFLLTINIPFHLISQNTSNLPDTTVTIKDCVETTIIKHNSRERTRTRVLDCFWNSGVDTVIEVKDCIKSTILSKNGRQKTISEYLDCYWDDAIKTGDTIITPHKDKRWKVKIYSKFEKNGTSKSFSSSITINEKESYRLGLDSLERKKQNLKSDLYKKIKYLDENPTDIYTVRDTTISQTKVLFKINELRQLGCICGEKSMHKTTNLKWSNRLTKIAYLHAKDMYERDYFSHLTPEGKTPKDRVDASGMKNLSYRGENIAKGNLDGIAAVKAWKKSPGHCKNMMHPQHQHVGVARYMDKYVMLLGIDKDLNKTE